MRAVRAILVDCYGTLVTTPDLTDAFLRVLPVEISRAAQAAFEHVRSSEAGALKVPFRTQRQRFTILAELALDRLMLGSSYLRPCVDSMMDAFVTVTPATGCVPFLLRAKEVGPVVMATNADNDLLDGVLAQLPQVFDAVVTSETLRAYKPDIRVFRTAIEASGCQPEHCVMFGDDIARDVRPAEALGCRAIQVSQALSSNYDGERVDDLLAAVDILDGLSVGK